MKKLFFVSVVILISTFLMSQTEPIFPEFPIAVGIDSTGSICAAFDGTNYLVAIQGDMGGHSNITAQLVSSDGSLVGTRISVGGSGGYPRVVFNGTNYLLVWDSDINYPDNDIIGQFVDTSGNLVGSGIPIAITLEDETEGWVVWGNSTFLVLFHCNDNIYAQFVEASGNLIGNPVQINATDALHDLSAAFDGNNFLIVWIEDTDDKAVYGQFISESGSLVGSNFLIDESVVPGEAPLAVVFDGVKYLVCFTDDIDTTYWDIFGRFVTTDGIVQDRFTICDNDSNEFLPMITFVEDNYIIAWTDLTQSLTKLRYFDSNGVAISPEYILAEPQVNNDPLAGALVPGNDIVLAVTTRYENGYFENGDVFGHLIPECTSVLENVADLPLFCLHQNYPNPFNPETTISFSLAEDAKLEIFNIKGQKIKTFPINQLTNQPINQVVWDGKDESGNAVSSGIYLYRLEAGNYSSTKKMLLMK